MSHFKIILLLVCSLLSYSTLTHAESKKMEPQTAIFAMGCFWCGESEFTHTRAQNPLPGILSLRVGYTGGTSLNPTYPSHEGHQEAVQIVFDPTIISYDKLLNIFWHNIDPLDPEGQFCDKGHAYQATIFYSTPEQKSKAEKSKAHWETILGQSIVTKLQSATHFHDAEEYHQHYAAKNPVRYHYYRWNCGRDARLKALWGDPAHEN